MPGKHLECRPQSRTHLSSDLQAILAVLPVVWISRHPNGKCYASTFVITFILKDDGSRWNRRDGFHVLWYKSSAPLINHIHPQTPHYTAPHYHTSCLLQALSSSSLSPLAPAT